MVREICYCLVSSGVTAPGVVRVVCACASMSVWCASVCAGGAAARAVVLSLPNAATL